VCVCVSVCAHAFVQVDLYANLFYILQAEPIYMARLIYMMDEKRMSVRLPLSLSLLSLRLYSLIVPPRLLCCVVCVCGRMGAVRCP